MMRWDEEATRGGDDFLEAVKLDMFPARGAGRWLSWFNLSNT